ncbi:MAG: HesA/MoeB/ThiF family protein [Clostridiales bacterium]|nr:HesA/MoeB/ThiF family protein [Clostridiales bacterium]
MVTFTPEQLERYSRHFVLPEIGVSGQKKLLSSKVLVIGAGALGSTALMYLASSGIGTIGIADYDKIELSNLQRQIIHTTESVGQYKANSAKITINNINPDVSVALYKEKITVKNIIDIIRNYDFIIDGSDNFGTKFLINDACVLERKPYSHAGAVKFGGQTMTYLPGKGPCLRCLLGTVPPPNEVCSCSQAGVLGVVPGIIGCIQALEAIKYILGIGDLLTGKVLSFDALHTDIHIMNVQRSSPECDVCGEHPTIISIYDNKNDYEQNETCSIRGV